MFLHRAAVSRRTMLKFLSISFGRMRMTGKPGLLLKEDETNGRAALVPVCGAGYGHRGTGDLFLLITAVSEEKSEGPEIDPEAVVFMAIHFSVKHCDKHFTGCPDTHFQHMAAVEDMIPGRQHRVQVNVWLSVH